MESYFTLPSKDTTIKRYFYHHKILPSKDTTITRYYHHKILPSQDTTKKAQFAGANCVFNPFVDLRLRTH